jgi:predicted Rdx family selenoprotein
LLAFIVLWLAFGESLPQLAQDFEECVEQIQTTALSNDGVGALMTDCNVRFAGRRKADGGYTYYDFMQDRIFDIAGPNPTAEERKQIDREYINYLDAQRREAVSAELAKRQNEQLRVDLERTRQPIGPPMVLTPTSLPPAAGKRLVDRSKAIRCGDDSLLSCSWAKFSTAVKNAFASSSRTKP